MSATFALDKACHWYLLLCELSILDSDELPLQVSSNLQAW